MVSKRVMTLSDFFNYFLQRRSFGERQTLASVFLFFVFFGGYYRSHVNIVAEKEKEVAQGNFAHALSRVAEDMRQHEDNRMVSNSIVPDHALFLIDRR